MSDIHQQIVSAYENYLKESEAFEAKGVKAAATRARGALNDLGKLTKSRRKEIQDKKNSMAKA
jgi:N-glycosylase/DNA lyase